ncbi:hypothetical protein chiPu_0033991, partial [Chiloscyllium punctatum]|nr:hypothetical protein [Chiloscyllium punctatum]
AGCRCVCDGCPAAGRTPPPPVAGRARRHQSEGWRRLLACRDRRRGSPRRFRAAKPGRHRALSRLCAPVRRRDPLGIHRLDPRHVGGGRGLLPGRRHLPGADLPQPAPPDDADDLVMGLRVPAVHRDLLPRQARRRSLAGLAVIVLLRRPCSPDRRAAGTALDGPRLG